MESQVNKPHRKHTKGQTVVKKKQKSLKRLKIPNSKNVGNQASDVQVKQQYNKKAFTFKSSVRAAKSLRRTLDKDVKRHHLPKITHTASKASPPPYIVAVVGPPKVGKSTLIRSLVKNYTRQNMSDVIGPITLVSGKKRRITFIEVQNDICSMIDTAKIADLCLLLVDASFGFEIETFEFLNILQVHGFPQVMGVLTHLDLINKNKTLQRTKKQLRHRFWSEIYQGAKVFYLTGVLGGGLYPKMEVHNLGRFVSVMKFKQLQWRINHSFIVSDRLEDLTPKEEIRLNPIKDRTIALYGFVRGRNLMKNGWVHISGCGDCAISEVKLLEDPCPMPDSQKKRRSLNEKERIIYAPNCGIGHLSIDNDAVYIDLPYNPQRIKFYENFGAKKCESIEASNELMKAILNTRETIQEKFLASGGIRLFGDSAQICIADSDKKQSLNENEEENLSDNMCNGSNNSEQNATEIAENLSENESDTNEQNNEIEEIKKGFEKLISSETWNEMYEEYLEGKLAKHKNLHSYIYNTDTQITRNSSLKNQRQSELIGDLFIKRESIDHENEDSSLPIKRISISKLNEQKIFSNIKCLFASGHVIQIDPNIENENDFEMADNENDMEINDNDDNGDDSSSDEDPNNIESENIDASSVSEEPNNIENDNKESVTKNRTTVPTNGNTENSILRIGNNENRTSNYINELKSEVDEQMNINKEEFEDLESVHRANYLGYDVGLYVRLRIDNVPHEFVTNVNPRVPIIVGSVSQQELNTQSFLNIRIKQHRWHKKVLKTKDPIIVSVGWRRFQTIPVYFIEEHNKRKRMLKYTPEHSHCQALLTGPITTPGTGILAVQKLGANKDTGYRVALSGVTLENTETIDIVKKLKLVGTPYKVYKNTAFIKGMFNTALEVAKFEKACIQTVSGIRGQIKRALNKPPGCFRASFEDKILKSDIVFLRSWYQIHVPKFYNPVCNLLDSKWAGMRTIAEIRKDKGLPVPFKHDSLYKQIERKPPRHIPLKIPKNLEKSLPYKSRPKYSITSKKLGSVTNQKAVILEPYERKVMSMMQKIRATHNDQLRTLKSERTEQRKRFAEKKGKIELKRLQNTKLKRKEFFKKVGQRKGKK